MAQEPKLRDWRILKSRWGNTLNYNFSNIENCRFLEPPYVQLDATFDRDDSYVEKRYPYRTIYSSMPTNGNITDTIRIYESNCDRTTFNKYYLWKNKAGDKLRVYKQIFWDCEVIQTWEYCTCPCWYDKFTEISWPIDANNTSLQGSQINEWKTIIYKRQNWWERSSTTIDWIEWVEWDSSYVDGWITYEERRLFVQWDSYVDFWWTQAQLDLEVAWWEFAIGRYIVAYDINGGSAPTIQNPNGYGTITQINTITWFEDGKVKVANARQGFFVGNNWLQSVYQTEGTNVVFRVFKDRWDTFGFTDCTWFKQWTWDGFLTMVKNWSNKCRENVNNNNGVLSFVTQNWFINYGWVGTLQYFFNVLQSRNIGKLVELTTFDQYTVWFTQNTLKVAAFTISNAGVTWQVYNTDSTRGIRWKGAYSVSMEWLKMIDSQRNFWYITLEPTQYWTFKMKWEDKSDWIRQHLSKIQDEDDVSVFEDGNEIRIIITSHKKGWYLHRTKSLIYDKFMAVRHIHTSLACEIRYKKYDEYLGQNVWTDRYPGVGDNTQDANGWAPFEQKIEWFLVSNKEKTSFQQCTLKDFFLLIGNRTRASKWLTTFTLDHLTNCWKPTYRLDDPSSICYLKMLDDIRNWDLVTPTQDALNLLEECGIYNDECSNSQVIAHEDHRDDLDPPSLCLKRDEQIFEDYGVCVNNKKYYLSEFTKAEIILPLSNIACLWYKFTISAKWVDSFHTGWFMWYYMLDDFTTTDDLMCEQRRACKECDKIDCNCSPKVNEEWAWCSDCN